MHAFRLQRGRLIMLSLLLQMIHRLGREINHPDSIYYWAYKHKIPVYCPALTDGSLGDMLYFHTFKNPGLVLDIIADIRSMNDEAMKAPPRKTGVVILGGGEPSTPTLNYPVDTWMPRSA